ncbi:ATP-binding protein [Aquabacterium sp. CECT 9606]|uniref:hybrid sensor histidine kinase/response regulator n=1 Tax=Aquabacterium sp. CECT 9606 TaxID=2845822 RepID=UPI001E6157C9|nr:ATP-binding protein [Aquabacterium sp. CECT 9606]CAH0351270.1 Sensor histidine kinase RcsC [Aquabacterium sp. CECT 9606]
MPASPSPMLPSAETLFEQAASGLLLTNPDGTILRANATFCRWIGQDADDLVGQRRVQELFTMGGRVFYQTHWLPLLQIQGSVAEVKLDMVHRDGSHVPMLLNAIRRQHGDTTYHELAVIVVRDRHKYEDELVQARKNAEAALAAQHEAQRALQETADVLGLAMRGGQMGAWSRNLSTNQVWWSSQLEVLMGLPTDGFASTEADFFDFVHEDDLLKVRQVVDQAIRLGTDYSVEFRFRHAGGQWRWMEGRGRAAYDAQGKPTTLYGLGIDITERKHSEDQWQEISERLAQADRRKDEFLATLAHELRNPLAPMRNVVELLKRQALNANQLRWTREVLERQLQHMTHLVDDLLEVSRITQGKLELRRQPVELVQAVNSALEAATPLVQAAGHELTVDLPEQPILLDADPTRLTQIILNLLNNATKYTPPGGRIWLGIQQADERATVTVRDSGLGIPREQLTNIFEMFSQLTPALDRSQGGLGIGLALVRGLVELHGGTVAAHSDGPGMGSEFIVTLPLAQGTSTLPMKADKPDDDASRAKRILVVDDNEDAAESLEMLLGLQGHEVRSAGDGMAALRLAGEFLPELTLLDIGLPKLNGYEVAKLIRQQPWGANMLLVAVTGWGQAQDKQAADAAGFDRHLTKPVNPEDLRSILSGMA